MLAANAAVSIACRNRLYACFIRSLVLPDSLSAFREDAKSVATESPTDAGYLKDRTMRFERVLKKWPQIHAISGALDRDLALGASLFNEGLFFDCHEYLEGAWKRCEGQEKIMLQGLIQAAAGFHKWELGSPAGYAELLGKAIQKLSKIRDPRYDFLPSFVSDLRLVLAKIPSGTFDLSQAPNLLLK